MTTKNRNRGNKSNIGTSKEKSSLLASAIIQSPRDTDILEEDLASEFNPDRYDTDSNLLVNEKWVRFFNKESSTLKSLMANVNNSTTLRNILNQKTTLSLGDGFIPYKSTSVPILQTVKKLIEKLFAVDGDIEQLNELVGNVNLNNETLEEVMSKLFFDYYAFGNAIVEFIKGKKGGKEVTMMYHVPLHKVAIKKVDESNIIKYIGISNDWDTQTGSDTDILQVPIYPNFENVNGSKRSCVHIKCYSPGFFYWGLPSYYAARLWTEIEYRIPKYNISKFKNSFTPSAIVQFYGQMSQEEASDLIQNVQDTFTDTDNNSKICAQVLSDEKYKMQVQVLEDKSEGNWLTLADLASQAIITACQWTKGLSGYAQAGKLGTNQQTKEELEYVVNTGIKPVRRKFLQSIINPFVKENAEQGNAPKDIKLDIANMNPISLAGSLVASQILTTDEQRKILGYEAMDENGRNELLKNQQDVNSNNINPA